MESSITISAMEMQEEKYQQKEAELVGAQDAELDIFARQAINEGRARRAELLRRIDEVSTERRAAHAGTLEAMDAAAKMYQLIQEVCDLAAKEASVRSVARATQNKEFRSGEMIQQIKASFEGRNKRSAKKNGGRRKKQKKGGNSAEEGIVTPTAEHGHVGDRMRGPTGVPSNCRRLKRWPTSRD